MARYFTKKDIQMANKHMNRCLISLIIKEMQMRYHHTLIRIGKIKYSDNTRCL